MKYSSWRGKWGLLNPTQEIMLSSKALDLLEMFNQDWIWSRMIPYLSDKFEYQFTVDRERITYDNKSSKNNQRARASCLHAWEWPPTCCLSHISMLSGWVERVKETLCQGQAELSKSPQRVDSHSSSRALDLVSAFDGKQTSVSEVVRSSLRLEE